MPQLPKASVFSIQSVLKSKPVPVKAPEAVPVKALEVTPVKVPALKPKSPTSAKPTIWADLNAKPPLLHMNGEVAELCEGECGFACADFGAAGILQSEVPNLILRQQLALQLKQAMAVLKKPAAHAAAAPAPVILLKKPAAAVKKPAPVVLLKKPAAALKKPAAAILPKSRFAVMYYKKSRCVAVRQKFLPKKQVFQFGGKTCDLGEFALRELCKRAIAKLEDGLSYGDAKKWAADQLSRDAD